MSGIIVEPGNEERAMERDSGYVIVRVPAVGFREIRLKFLQDYPHTLLQSHGKNDDLLGAAGTWSCTACNHEAYTPMLVYSSPLCKYPLLSEPQLPHLGL